MQPSLCTCTSSRVSLIHARIPCASTHIIHAEGFFEVMCEADIRFPPALSLLTRVWVGVTEVPPGVAKRSSQSVRGLQRGYKSDVWPGCSLLLFCCELFSGLAGLVP